MQSIYEQIVDQSKYIVDLALKLRNLDLEIAKNPNCYELKSRRLAVLDDLHEKSRIEMVQAAAELRRFRTRGHCIDCMRCESYSEFI